MAKTGTHPGVAVAVPALQHAFDTCSRNGRNTCDGSLPVSGSRLSHRHRSRHQQSATGVAHPPPRPSRFPAKSKPSPGMISRSSPVADSIAGRKHGNELSSLGSGRLQHREGELQVTMLRTVLPGGAVRILLCWLSYAEGRDRTEPCHAVKVQQLHVRLLVLDAWDEASFACRQCLGHQPGSQFESQHQRSDRPAVCAPRTGRQCRRYHRRCVHLAQAWRVQVYADVLTLLKHWKRQDMLCYAAACMLNMPGCQQTRRRCSVRACVTCV